jgi:hypothetical protein
MKITKFKVNGQEASVAESALDGKLLPLPSASDKGKVIVVNDDLQYVLANIEDVLPVEIVPWATGTDEQIAKMIAALDDGRITIQDTGWQIGDERTVSLAAMEATGVGETHAAQEVTLVIMDSQHYDLVGGGKDHFVVGLKNCLNEMGYMNSTDTSAGSWEASARRTWCNNVFKNAIPATLRNCFKQFNVITCTEWDGTTNTTSNDYFALFAEKEVFGERIGSNETEAAALTQIEYYATEANRIKTVNGEAGGWWERSPDTYLKGDGDSFCVVYFDGEADSDFASIACGLAPFGCI